MGTTLYRGRVYAPGDPTALLVRDGEIAWVGAAADAGPADRTVEAGDRLITPAFVDAHVHATSTGLPCAASTSATPRLWTRRHDPRLLRRTRRASRGVADDVQRTRVA